jgi:hypothetical protein
MSGIPDYSSTPASNTTINSISIIGNASPAGFDNALRQLMADLATARTDGALASMPYATKSAGYTLLTTDRGKLIDCTAALEIELLAAATAGAGFFFVVKANGGAVTLDPNGVEEINGSSTSATVANGASAIVVCNGTAWFTVTIGAGGATLTSLEGLTLGAGDMLYATAADTLADLAIGTAGQFLVTNAGATAPEWASRPTLVSLEGLTLGAGDMLYATAADTLADLAIGTAGQSLIVNAGATAPSWGSSIVNATAQASTSGTAIDFTSIPSWVKRITFAFSALSTNGTSIPIIQIGDSGGIEASGYVGAAADANDSDFTTGATQTTGFPLNGTAAAGIVIHGAIVLTLIDASTNTWVAALSGARSDSASLIAGGGSKSLTATLDRVRLTTVNGTDTFDAGKVNILYE